MLRKVRQIGNELNLLRCNINEPENFPFKAGFHNKTYIFSYLVKFVYNRILI